MNARCGFHPGREASARCLGCGLSFCRECVTEHEGKMYCQRCLAARTASGNGKDAAAGWGGLAARGALAAGGMLLLFALFSLMLAWVAAIPTHHLTGAGPSAASPRAPLPHRPDRGPRAPQPGLRGSSDLPVLHGR